MKLAVPKLLGMKLAVPKLVGMKLAVPKLAMRAAEARKTGEESRVRHGGAGDSLAGSGRAQQTAHVMVMVMYNMTRTKP